MGRKLFGIDIAKTVDDAVRGAGGIGTGTLTQKAKGTRTAGDLTGGTQPTETTQAFRGMVESYRTSEVDGTRIQVGDQRVLILGESLDGKVPKKGDDVTIDGVTYHVVRVDADPAQAAYTLQVRG